MIRMDVVGEDLREFSEWEDGNECQKKNSGWRGNRHDERHSVVLG